MRACRESHGSWFRGGRCESVSPLDCSTVWRKKYRTPPLLVVSVPAGEESLAKAVGRTHSLYSQYLNRFHKRSGHLWQNCFYSCVLDETHLWRALAYVERNPVRARRQ